MRLSAQRLRVHLIVRFAMDPHDRYGYEDALSARMVEFGEDEVCRMDAGGGDEDYEESEEGDSKVSEFQTQSPGTKYRRCTWTSRAFMDTA